MTHDDVFSGVCECLAVVLDTRPDAVREDQRLVADLDADSLDLLDLTFHLERRFGVSISPRDIEHRAREKLNGRPFTVDGKFTPEALAELKAAMPEVPAEEFPADMPADALPRRLRVASMVNLVSRLLQEKEAKSGQ
ncbi:MAG: phosphopantetheine-binding protein [Planctomycetota bacterium]|nr:phosphopantetheine-binding protein [Planctomycetota bacterium]